MYVSREHATLTSGFPKPPTWSRRRAMPVIAAIVALAAVVWGAIYTRRGSLVVACALVLVVSYALGHEFWNANVGPLPLTIDRLLLIGLAAPFAIRWRAGQLAMRP